MRLACEKKAAGRFVQIINPVSEIVVWVSISNLEHSGRIADDVSELKDVGSELLLHVTEEKHCAIGGESTDGCHCKKTQGQRKEQDKSNFSDFSRPCI